MTHIDDLPSEILFQLFHDLRSLAGGPSEDPYGSSLVHASAVCQRWFELTFVVYWQDKKKKMRLIGGAQGNWRKEMGIEYHLWSWNVKELASRAFEGGTAGRL